MIERLGEASHERKKGGEKGGGERERERWREEIGLLLVTRFTIFSPPPAFTASVELARVLSSWKYISSDSNAHF